MTKYFSDISWETEVWTADAPTHMIHFNGWSTLKVIAGTQTVKYRYFLLLMMRDVKYLSRGF